MERYVLEGGSIRYVLGMDLTYLCCPALLTGSPPKDREINSEILILIRKECEDQKREKKYRSLWSKK